MARQEDVLDDFSAYYKITLTDKRMIEGPVGHITDTKLDERVRAAGVLHSGRRIIQAI